jgi:hypothetical protein
MVEVAAVVAVWAVARGVRGVVARERVARERTRVGRVEARAANLSTRKSTQ